MKVPTIPTARIAILIASFAFIFTIVVLLSTWDFVSLLGPSVASDLSNASLVPNPAHRSAACRPQDFLQNRAKSAFSTRDHLGPGPGRARQLKQKRYYVTLMLGGGRSRQGPVYSLRHGRFGRTGCRCHGRGTTGSRKRAP